MKRDDFLFLLAKTLYFSSFMFSIVFAAVSYVVLREMFLVVVFTVVAIPLLLLPYVIWKQLSAHRHHTESLLTTLQGFAGGIFFVCSFGTIYFYMWDGFEYDIFVHIIVSILTFFIIAFTYKAVRLSRNHQGVYYKEAIFFSIIITFILGFMWEAFESFADSVWGTQMFFDSDQSKMKDFVTDIIANWVGIIFGSLVLMNKWEKLDKKWLKKRHKV